MLWIIDDVCPVIVTAFPLSILAGARLYLINSLVIKRGLLENPSFIDDSPKPPWLVVWNMAFIFSYIGNVIIPTIKIGHAL